MITKFLRMFLLLGTLSLTGCGGCESYYKCDNCGAVYKYTAGLPGQINKTTCRNCGGRLRPVPKENSGWDEDRYQKHGNEVPY